MTTEQIKSTINQTFEEIALVLDGIFAVHNVDNEVVWQTMKHLDMIHSNLSDKLGGMEKRPDFDRNQSGNHDTHPAVDALLAKLQKRHLHGGPDL